MGHNGQSAAGESVEATDRQQQAEIAESSVVVAVHVHEGQLDATANVTGLGQAFRSAADVLLQCAVDPHRVVQWVGASSFGSADDAVRHEHEGRLGVADVDR